MREEERDMSGKEEKLRMEEKRIEKERKRDRGGRKEEKERKVTFTKRKFGLMKKAYELSVLCDCEIALIIFNHSNKLFQYASTDMDKVLLKYTEYNEPHESRTNADIIEALNKKEHRDSESPDPEEPFSLTPRTEEKYKKIDEEFDKMMQNYRLSVSALLGGDLGNSNGACPSPVPNGYISARGSPGLLSISNGNSMGKVVPAKSPPPPSPQMVNSRKPDLRVITSQGGKSLIQLTEEELELVSENAQRLGGSQVAQSLTTPVVSVATPSLLAPFSGIQAYNTEYQLMSADLTALQTFTPPGLVPGNMAAWQQQQQQQTSMGQAQQQQISLGALSNLVPVSHLSPGAALTVNTNPNVSIKTEPVSPNRDRSTPSSLSQGALNHIQVPGVGHQGLVSIAYPGALRLDAGARADPPWTVSAVTAARTRAANATEGLWSLDTSPGHWYSNSTTSSSSSSPWSYSGPPPQSPRTRTGRV
ncbi:hypothetical protein WMY93_026577 [Mugilogobius chulae]|uniref:MADS-box domain-containing protein n=1 Tax=Mugilogobius chulae TaxID=88201 RepID=A0AAW0N2Q8_9GOBI